MILISTAVTVRYILLLLVFATVRNREEFRPKSHCKGTVFKVVTPGVSEVPIEEQAEQETIRSAHCHEDLRSTVCDSRSVAVQIVQRVGSWVFCAA
jgi:hypothetical protein